MVEDAVIQRGRRGLGAGGDGAVVWTLWADSELRPSWRTSSAAELGHLSQVKRGLDLAS